MMERLREANIGTIKRREQDALARKALPKLRSFFRQQRAEFFRQFSKYKGCFPEARGELSARLIELDRQMTLNDFNSVWKEVEAESTDELQTLITRIEAEAVSQGADITKQFFDPKKYGGSFDLENPRAVAWFSEHGGSLEYIKDIQSTSKGQLQTIITQSLDEGWSYNQTSKAIRERFSSFTTTRAQLIATHESAQAYEAGNRIFVDTIADMGVVMEKRWMNSRDEKVTPECQTNTDDGWISLNHTHTSGDQQPPRFPGCRCWEIYREKKG